MSIAGVVKRVFWGVITAVCVSVLIYHLTSSCILYFSHETAVNVALVTRRQLTFPAVTICNLNPVKQSAVSESSALSRLISDDNRKRRKRDNSVLRRVIGDNRRKRRKRATVPRPLVEIYFKGRLRYQRLGEVKHNIICAVT